MIPHEAQMIKHCCIDSSNLCYHESTARVKAVSPFSLFSYGTSMKYHHWISITLSQACANKHLHLPWGTLVPFQFLNHFRMRPGVQYKVTCFLMSYSSFPSAFILSIFLSCSTTSFSYIAFSLARLRQSYTILMRANARLYPQGKSGT